MLSFYLENHYSNKKTCFLKEKYMNKDGRFWLKKMFFLSDLNHCEFIILIVLVFCSKYHATYKK